MKAKPIVMLATSLCLLGFIGLELLPESLPSTADPRAASTTGASRSRRDRAAAPASLPRHERSLREPSVQSGGLPDGRWLGDDLSHAVLVAQAMEPGKLRDRLLQQAIRAWAAKSPDDARQWIVRMPDAGERDRLLLTIDPLNQEPTEEPAKPLIEQLAEAVSLAEADDSNLTRVKSLAGRWAGEDLGEALTWARSQPAGEIRDELLHRVALVQAASEPAQAAQLVAGEIPSGPVQTEAILSVIHRWANDDPGAAAAWAAAFPQGPLRERVQRELAGLDAYHAKSR